MPRLCFIPFIIFITENGCNVSTVFFLCDCLESLTDGRICQWSHTMKGQAPEPHPFWCESSHSFHYCNSPPFRSKEGSISLYLMASQTISTSSLMMLCKGEVGIFVSNAKESGYF